MIRCWIPKIDWKAWLHLLKSGNQDTPASERNIWLIICLSLLLESNVYHVMIEVMYRRLRQLRWETVATLCLYNHATWDTVFPMKQWISSFIRHCAFSHNLYDQCKDSNFYFSFLLMVLKFYFGYFQAIINLSGNYSIHLWLSLKLKSIWMIQLKILS